MNKHKIPIVFVVLLFLQLNVSAQQKRTIDFIGGARSFISNNRIHVQDSIPDTTTIKRNTGGYALIDLGLDIRPNKSTEILGMFRIRNNYGGFWGSGVSFDVRQLWLKGIIGNVVRYQVGDLNLQQSPYTLFNHHADKIDSLPAIFNLQNQLISYEKYYQKNTWHQQGVNADFGLTFSKIVKEIDFTGYLTRLLATNFSTTPDRLMGGFSTKVIQSKHFSFGYNYFSVFDVKGTVLDSNTYNNNVNTVSLAYTSNIGSKQLELKAELGSSRAEYSQFIEASQLKDKFINASAKLLIPKQHLALTLGYMNVGPDFRSIGAQSKDVNYNFIPGYFNTIGNNQSFRAVDLFDVIRNENIYNAGVSVNLMAVNPVYNNALPYGEATFNREGIFAKASYNSPKGIFINAEHHYLSEIRGQGTYQLKKFSVTKILASVDVNTIAHFTRLMRIQFGMNSQSTNRTSNAEVDNVKLNTTLYQAGIEYEIIPKVDLLFGITGVNCKGNEFTTERNAYSKAEYFTRNSYDLTQQISALGFRFRFDAKTNLSAVYQSSNNQDKLNMSPDYQTDQFALIFNMTF